MSQAVWKVWPLGPKWETKDPFLFCAHHVDKYPKGNSELGPDASLMGRRIGMDFTLKDGWRMYHGEIVPGFPSHPHRGFETVTVVQSGFVDHSDSYGSFGRYGMGDTQWMTAGSGLQHSEMFPLLNSDSENHLELFQIWLNLPSYKKMVDPFYKMLWNKDTPVCIENPGTDHQVKIKLIAGEWKNYKAPLPAPDSWAANPDNKVSIHTIQMDSKSQFTLAPLEAGISRTLYFYKGSKLTVNGISVSEYHGIDLDSSLEVVVQSQNTECSLLLLQGKPILEHVVQYGPFVMNTKEEIEQALSDYHRTQFGGWPWKTTEPVHGKEKKKFARYLDNSEEYPED